MMFGLTTTDRLDLQLDVPPQLLLQPALDLALLAVEARLRLRIRQLVIGLVLTSLNTIDHPSVSDPYIKQPRPRTHAIAGRIVSGNRSDSSAQIVVKRSWSSIAEKAKMAVSGL